MSSGLFSISTMVYNWLLLGIDVVVSPSNQTGRSDTEHPQCLA